MLDPGQDRPIVVCVRDMVFAGIHLGKSEHTRTERLAMTTSLIFRKSRKGKQRKVAVRQVCRGLISSFQGVTPGRKACLPGKTKAVC